MKKKLFGEEKACGVPYSRLEWPSQMLDWPALLGCLELADMADIGWGGKVPSFWEALIK